MEDEFLTTKEVAKLLKVSIQTIKIMLNNGIIEGFKVGGQWRFSRKAVIEWVQAGKATKKKEGE